MKIERHGQELSTEEHQELIKLKGIIEAAIADGILSKTEEDTIKDILISRPFSAELVYQELQMCRDLITDKVNQGLLVTEQFDQI